MTTYLDDDICETIVNRVNARVLGEDANLDELSVDEIAALEKRLDAIVDREVDAFAEKVSTRTNAGREGK